MHNDPLDDLFANVAPESPLAEEMQALLQEGLAIEESELDAATDAVYARMRPRRPWGLFGAMGLIAAAALVGFLVWKAPEAQIAPVESPEVAAHPIANPPTPPRPQLAPDVLAEIADRVDVTVAALQSGNYALALLHFNQLLEQGDLSELQLRKLTIFMHSGARNAEDEETQLLLLEQTVAGYEAWIATFPDEERAPDMNYAFAELLYKTQRYDEAFDHYMTVATRYPESKHAAFCAESAIFAAEQVIQLKRADGSWTGSDEPGLNRAEEQLIAAVDASLGAVPTGEKATTIQYKGAYLLYESGEYGEARERFRSVIEMDPSSPTALQAANLITDSFVIGQEWSGAEAAAYGFYEDQMGDEAFQSEMLTLARRAAMMQLEDAVLSADQVADGWLALLEKYGDADDARDKAADALRAAGRDPDSLFE